jgi:hypothetical protein
MASSIFSIAGNPDYWLNKSVTEYRMCMLKVLSATKSDFFVNEAAADRVLKAESVLEHLAEMEYAFLSRPPCATACGDAGSDPCGCAPQSADDNFLCQQCVVADLDTDCVFQSASDGSLSRLHVPCGSPLLFSLRLPFFYLGVLCPSYGLLVLVLFPI